MTDIVERLREAAEIADIGRPPQLLRTAADEIERLRVTLHGIRAKSSQMAEDDGLWFKAETAAEAYLQQELRQLCAVIEGVSPDECARAAYDCMRATGEEDGLAVKLPMRRPYG